MINLKIFDLTHQLSTRIPTWDASCGFISDIRHDYDESVSSVSFRVQQLSMHAGIGTHIDAPAHCFSSGKTIDQIPLSDLFAPCVMIDMSTKCHEDLKINVEHLLAWEKTNGPIPTKSVVIIHTGWDRFFNDAEKYRNNLKFPSVDKDVALYLLHKNILGLGVDTLSPDRADSGYPVHEILLGSGAYILENVANSAALPAIGAHILALPLKIKQGTEAPLRLIGITLPQL